MTRVAVFVDYQNVYMRARDAFGAAPIASHTFGQVRPDLLGALMCAKGVSVDPRRSLREVRLYRGVPDVRYNPSGHRACGRQVASWNAEPGVVTVTRPLRYLASRWDGTGRAVGWTGREKGIDVLLAIDLVMGAVRDAYDVAVLVSADTDLVPALEAVIDAGKRVEVASWRPDRGPGLRLSVPGRRVWCHHLRRPDFESVRDDTDYTKPVYGG